MARDNGKEMNKALFLNMVMMFSTSAMQQLGKIVNPGTGKTSVDLQGAQFFIDLLAMMKEKTTNNLDADETRLLNDTLATLQINFVETSEDEARKGTKEAPAGAAGTSPSEAGKPAEGAEQPKAKPDEKDPKFRKSYG